MIAPGRLVFGTDYPHEMARPQDARAYLEGINDVVTGAGDRRGMFGANVLALMGRPG